MPTTPPQRPIPSLYLFTIFCSFQKDLFCTANKRKKNLDYKLCVFSCSMLVPHTTFNVIKWDCIKFHIPLPITWRWWRRTWTAALGEWTLHGRMSLANSIQEAHRRVAHAVLIERLEGGIFMRNLVKNIKVPTYRHKNPPHFSQINIPKQIAQHKFLERRIAARWVENHL